MCARFKKQTKKQKSQKLRDNVDSFLPVKMAITVLFVFFFLIKGIIRNVSTLQCLNMIRVLYVFVV